MAERRTIGQILMGFGRISEEDVEKALEHQQEAGGVLRRGAPGCGIRIPG